MNDTDIKIIEKRSGFCYCVEQALDKLNIDSTRVLNAVNGMLAEVDCVAYKASLTDGKHSKQTKTKESKFKVSQRLSARFEGRRSVVSEWDEWTCALAKVSALAFIPAVDIPDCFLPWLGKFQAEPKQIAS